MAASYEGVGSGVCENIICAGLGVPERVLWQ